MTGIKAALVKGVVLAAFAGGVLAASAASADVACNRYGECWKVKDHYANYPAELGVVFHDDAWYATNRHDRHWHFRHDRDDDHGYYAHGSWHRF